MIPWFSKTEGNTYATLLHQPFLVKGKPTHAQEVAEAYLKHHEDKQTVKCQKNEARNNVLERERERAKSQNKRCSVGIPLYVFIWFQNSS